MIYDRESMKKYGRACVAVALVEAAEFIKTLHDPAEFTPDDLEKVKEGLKRLAEPGILGLEKTL